MNLAHVHLLLNHFPTIGFVVGLTLFVAAIVAKSEELKRASYVVLFLIALVAIPTYLSGNAAEFRLCPERKCPPGVSLALIRAHEDRALLAFALMELTAFIAWIGLWQSRRTSRLPGWNVGAVLLLAIVTFGLMGLAANEGGEIRHPEIQTEVEAAEAAGGDTAAGEIEEASGIVRSMGGVASGATGNSWLWPASEAIHFVGLSLLFTAVLVVDLRVLGMIKQVPFAAVYQLLPLGMLGFVLNLATGMLFFIGAPGQYTNNVVFYWKIVFIVLAGINALYFTLFDEIWAVKAGSEAPLRAKVVAASAIFLWAGVLYCGHMLPFLGNSF